MNHEEPTESTKTQQTRERILGELVQCKYCSNEFHPAGGTDYKTDINGDYVCEECVKGAVKLQTFGSPYDFTMQASFFVEDASTGYYRTKAEARARILEMAAALWPNKPIIEE